MTQTYAYCAPTSTLELHGVDGIDLLHRLSTNDLRPLARGEAVVTPTLLTDQRGKLLDWLWVFKTTEGLLVQTSLQRGKEVQAWIERFTIMEDVVVHDVSQAWVHLTLYGPVADDLLPQSQAHWFIGCCGRQQALIPASDIQAWHNRLQAAGIHIMSDAMYALQRIRDGIPSSTHEFKQAINPLELRLQNVAISFKKGCYIGQEVISRIDSYDKLSRLLIGFRGHASNNLQHTDAAVKLFSPDDTAASIGYVTSIVYDAATQTVEGLAVINRTFAQPDMLALLQIEDVWHQVVLVDRLFWQ